MWTPASRRGLQSSGALLSRGRATAAAAAAAAAPPEASDEWLRARPFQEVPGPRPLPVVGNAWRFLPAIGEFGNMDLNDMLFHMKERYGNICKLEGLPGRPSMVYVFQPEDIEKLYRTEGPRPERHGIQSMDYYRRVARKEWFGNVLGLATTQGEEWYEFRRRVNQPMMQPRATKQYVPSIDDVAQDFTRRMIEIRDENMKMPPDFLNELNKWALESISLIALDTRLGCLDGNLPEDSEAQRMIDTAHVFFDSLVKLDIKPSLWRYVSTPAWRRLVKGQDFFYEVSMKHIDAAMERIRSKGAECVTQGELSVLEKLLLSNDDPRVACVMALDMMFAGIDTTANSSAIALYFLSKNPEVQEKLYKELRSQMPDSVTQPLTAEKLEDCKYLKACVKESMRLRPVALGGGRRVVVDDLVLGNYRIPRGVDVLTGNVVLTNSEGQFPQASEFRPERWFKASSEDSPAHPFTFMPFGFGPRTCIGRRFAELEVHALVARIIRRFRLEFEGEMRFRTTVLHGVGSPLTLKVTDRAS